MVPKKDGGSLLLLWSSLCILFSQIASQFLCLTGISKIMGAKPSVTRTNDHSFTDHENAPTIAAGGLPHAHSIATAGGDSPLSLRVPLGHQRSNSTSHSEAGLEYRHLRRPPRSGNRGRFFSLGPLGLSPRNEGHNSRTPRGASGGMFDSDSSSPDEDFAGLAQFIHLSQSLPIQLVSLDGIKCPICSKVLPSDDVECHLVMCLTKPRVTFNDDVLEADSGECAICLDEMVQGDTIARLPCLCIYHKMCISEWFKVKQSCPEHPSD